MTLTHETSARLSKHLSDMAVNKARLHLTIHWFWKVARTAFTRTLHSEWLQHSITRDGRMEETDAPARYQRTGAQPSFCAHSWLMALPKHLKLPPTLCLSKPLLGVFTESIKQTEQRRSLALDCKEPTVQPPPPPCRRGSCTLYSQGCLPGNQAPP